MSTTASEPVRAQETRAVGDAPRPPVAGRAGTLRQALPAVWAYAGVRLVGLLTLAIGAATGSNVRPAGMAGADDRPGNALLEVLTRWDGIWYVHLAQHGYDSSVTFTADGALVRTNVAFFPLFPWLIRALLAVGFSPWVAAVVIANLAGLAAAWGIGLAGAKIGGARVGIMLAVLWGALPHAVVQSMGYTESLFTALAAWALWALTERRYVLAGGLAGVAGLTRPTAAALVLAVVAVCLWAAIRPLRAAGGWGWAALRDGGGRPWLGALLAPSGLIGFLTWCAVSLHRADAYFWVQREAWDMRLGFGVRTLRGLVHTLHHHEPLAMYVTSAVLLAAVALFAMLLRETLRARGSGRFDALLPALLFAGVLLLTVLLESGDYYYAKGRLLVPAFPLLVPLASALAAARGWLRAAVLGALVAASAAYGTYLLLVWPLSP